MRSLPDYLRKNAYPNSCQVSPKMKKLKNNCKENIIFERKGSSYEREGLREVCVDTALRYWNNRPINCGASCIGHQHRPGDGTEN